MGVATDDLTWLERDEISWIKPFQKNSVQWQLRVFAAYQKLDMQFQWGLCRQGGLNSMDVYLDNRDDIRKEFWGYQEWGRANNSFKDSGKYMCSTSGIAVVFVYKLLTNE